MSEQKDATSLLDTLRELYRQVVDRMLRVRQTSYHPQATATGSGELRRQLHAYIKRVPASVPEHTLRATRYKSEIVPPGSSTGATGTNVETGARPHIDGPGLAEMHYSHTMQDSVGDKLLQASREHLQASMRAARMGNPETARLHAGIMESSLKEAAQFVDGERYRQFVKELGEELAEQTRLLEERKE